MRLKLLALGCALYAGAALAADPRDTVDALHQALENAAGEQSTWESRHEAIGPVVKATHDLDYIARFTVRRQWTELSAPQRQAFLQAFADLAVNTYVARFKSIEPGAFGYSGEEPLPRGRHQVAAFISPAEGEPVSLDYVLRSGDEGWKIINVVADGVSDLALKRAEYQRIISEQDFDALIAELKDQAQRLLQ